MVTGPRPEEPGPVISNSHQSITYFNPSFNQ